MISPSGCYDRDDGSNQLLPMVSPSHSNWPVTIVTASLAPNEASSPRDSSDSSCKSSRISLSYVTVFDPFIDF